jgi:hypothetical protein
VLASRIIAGFATMLAMSISVDASSAAISSEQAVAFLNQQRAANGIPGDLVNRPEWADGCAKHNFYSHMTGDWGHSENFASPYYTPEGAEAAGAAVIAMGGGYLPSGKNPWEWAPIHLYITLRPELTSAGYDASHGYACLRMYGGEPRPAPATPQFFSYPGPGTQGIYPDEYAAEWPYTPQQLVGIPEYEVTGTNILLFSLGTRGLDAESFSLRGPAGVVPARMVDENTSNEVGDGSWFAGGGVIVPEKPLAENTTYTVSVRWRNLLYGHSSDESEDHLSRTEFFSQEFSFTTGAMSPEGRERRPRENPVLRLSRAGRAGNSIRLRLIADGVLRGHRARFVVFRHERGCGRAFASAAGPCGWRSLGRPSKRTLRLRGTQVLSVRAPARWQKATIKARTRPFEVDDVRFAPALANFTIRR